MLVNASVVRLGSDICCTEAVYVCPVLDEMVDRGQAFAPTFAAVEWYCGISTAVDFEDWDLSSWIAWYGYSVGQASRRLQGLV